MAGHAEPDVLLDGELTVIGQITTASNATLVCDATIGDDSMRVVYKPVRGEQPLWDFPDGTLAGREVASYRISEALGWGVIPRTVWRDGPFGPGMVQRFIETVDRRSDDLGGLDVVDLCSPDNVPVGWFEILQAYDSEGQPVSLIHADDPRLQRMAVLDVVINNADRKGGHALEGVDGSVYGVDHGICLHSDNKLRTVLWGWAGQQIPAPLVVDVAEFVTTVSGRLGDELSELITDEEVASLAARAAAVAQTPVMPFPSGHRTIPWPAF
ncbi:putative repeat protein (TIGR03843 family) [Rhodococcus sp. 27YEA15]|uniref:SCO1664 family protein n=1 Tax=Rhodococcus sp. 27YEA15 TaxID=3156259 RepID=UPI003C7BC32E